MLKGKKCLADKLFKNKTKKKKKKKKKKKNRKISARGEKSGQN